MAHRPWAIITVFGHTSPLLILVDHDDGQVAYDFLATVPSLPEESRPERIEGIVQDQEKWIRRRGTYIPCQCFPFAP